MCWKLASLVAKFRPACCTRIGSTEDLYSETRKRLAKKQYVCASTGKAVSLSIRIARNLLMDNSRQREIRGKIAVSMQELEKSDDAGQKQDCGKTEFSRASEAAHTEAEAIEMRDLIAAASSRLPDLDCIDRAIFHAISDFVINSRNIPNDREIAQVIGAKQNTITVRRSKLQERLQNVIKGLGYIPASLSRLARRPLVKGLIGQREQI